MSTCTKWVTRAVITCKNWSSKIDYECTTWADEGSNQCSTWADEGSNQCTSWGKCHWYTPWNCIAGFFCRAWYWIAKWVCKAWYWVAKWVCKAFAWVVKAVCVAFSWFLQLVCVAWDWLRCAILALIRAIAGLFGQASRQPRVEHVFVLMLENRSFDHMFGLSGLTGTGVDGKPTTVDGADAARDSNVDPATGVAFPVGPGADLALKGTDEDPGHEFEDTVVALCGNGAAYPASHVYPPIDNSGFIANYRHSGSSTPQRIMRCFEPDQLPVLTKLALEYAICDNWFSSLPGPTWPNRFFALAASSGGLDGSPSSADIVIATTIEGYRFSNGNIFDLLDDYCIEWRIFEGDEFPVSFALSGMNLNALQGRFTDFDEFAAELSNPGFAPKFVFIEPKYGAHGFDITGPGDFTCGNSMHPLDDVTRGEQLIKTVYESIRNSPHWDTSLLIITFDEHGGFYDHVKPPAATPPGDVVTSSYVQHGFTFDVLGVRVPALVISPLIPRGVIDHTQYDHTSMLATVERLLGTRNLTNRDKTANDLLHLLSLAQPRADTPTSLPPPAINRHPLRCEEDEDLESLHEQRSDLMTAREEGTYRDQRVTSRPATSTQVGFAQVALLRVLNDVQQPGRDRWIERYKAIDSSIDAAIFMIDAKIKLRHDLDPPDITPPTRTA
jgi:phospholipase C